MNSQATTSRKKIQKPSSNKKPSGKKPLPGPTHLGHFLIMLLIKICRTILFVDIRLKVFVYFGIVVTLSVIGSIFTIPKTYLSEKRNIFNDYFLKLGWGWTLFCVGTYIFWTSLVYSSRNISKMCQHLMRLAVGTFWWYFCTKSFHKVEAFGGTCSDSQFGDPKACFKAGKSWQGFDISGHVFLEVLCSLIILEELQTFKDWQRLGALLEDNDLKNKRKITDGEITQSQKDYKIFTPCIKISVVMVAIISVLFDLMIITSTIYPFHTLSEVIMGFLVAVVAWLLSYYVVFQSGSKYPFVPCPVGECSLSFMK